MNKIKKNIFIIITLILAPFYYLHSQPKKTLFEQANQQYKNGKFKRAMELYTKIENKDAHTNYNIGNCAYKLKKYGLALLYWRRAEKKWGLFNRTELIQNIILLKETLHKKAKKTKKKGPLLTITAKMKNLFLSWIRSVPLIIIQVLFLLLWLFIFVYLRFLYKNRKKLSIITLFSLVAMLGIMLVIRYTFEATEYGVVTSKQASLISGPGEAFQTLQQLHEAQELTIKKESGQYYKVKIHKNTGWINKKDVGKV